MADDGNNWKPGDYIALVSLVISFITGIFNYLYTRRAFRLSTVPALGIFLTKESFQNFFYKTYIGTSVIVKFDNYSNAVTVSGINFSVKLVNPFRGWKLWKDKWLNPAYLVSNSRSAIPPLDSISFEPDISIDDFLIDILPNYLEKFVSSSRGEYVSKREKEKEGKHFAPIYYQVKADYPLRIALLVEYRSGTGGVRKYVVSKEYNLLPVYEKDDIKKLKGWELQEI